MITGEDTCPAAYAFLEKEKEDIVSLIVKDIEIQYKSGNV